MADSNSNGQGNHLDYIDMGLHEVQPWDGAPTKLAPGDYIVEVTDVKGDQSAAGKPKMVVSYKTIAALDAERNDDADREDEVGTVIPQSYSLDSSKDGVRRRLRSLTNALGVELDERGGFNPNDMIGQRMLVEARMDSYTETNAMTGDKTQRESCKLIRERPAPEEAAEDPAPPPPASRKRRGRAAAPAR